MKLIKANYFYFLIILIPALFLLKKFYNIVDLSVGEEAFYATSVWNWSPLYQYVYKILISLWSPTISFLIISYTLSLILVPLMIFWTGRNYGLSKLLSSGLCVFFMWSDWNFPAGSRVQVFNFIFVLLAMNLRFLRNKNLGALFSYIILATLSLYCRQDNLIILSFFLAYDFYKWLFEKNKKDQLDAKLILFVTLLILVGVLWQSNSREKDLRKTYAFAENVYRKQFSSEGLSNKEKHHYPMVLKNFGEANTLYEAIIFDIAKTKKHIFENIKNFPSSLFSTLIPQRVNQKREITIALCLLLICLIITEKRDAQKLKDRDLILLFSAISAKCFFLGALLHPEERYIFEMGVVGILTGLTFFKKTKKSGFSLKKKPKVETFLKTSLLFLSMTLVFNIKESYGHHESADFLQKLSIEKKTNVFSIGFCEWVLEKEKCFFPLKYVKFDTQLNQKDVFSHELVKSKGFKNYLIEHDITTVIVDDITRSIFLWAGLKRELDSFVSAPEDYGFSEVYEKKRVSFGKNRKRIKIFQLQEKELR